MCLGCLFIYSGEFNAWEGYISIILKIHGRTDIRIEIVLMLCVFGSVSRRFRYPSVYAKTK